MDQLERNDIPRLGTVRLLVQVVYIRKFAGTMKCNKVRDCELLHFRLLEGETWLWVS